MTQFSSREPFNDDPKPYVTYADHRRTEVRSKEWDLQSDGAVEYMRVFEPRPEYNRPQTNPTNPILVARRNHPGENIYYKDLPYWPSDSQIHHARRVLERLARFNKGAATLVRGNPGSKGYRKVSIYSLVREAN